MLFLLLAKQLAAQLFLDGSLEIRSGGRRANGPPIHTYVHPRIRSPPARESVRHRRTLIFERTLDIQLNVLEFVSASHLTLWLRDQVRVR